MFLNTYITVQFFPRKVGILFELDLTVVVVVDLEQLLVGIVIFSLHKPNPSLLILREGQLGLAANAKHVAIQDVPEQLGEKRESQLWGDRQNLLQMGNFQLHFDGQGVKEKPADSNAVGG